MKTPLAVLAVTLLVACAEPGWVPIAAPAIVVVTDADIGDDELSLIGDAGDAWYYAVPGSILSVGRGVDSGACGAIYVARLRDPEQECAGKSRTACIIADGCNAHMYVAPLDGGQMRGIPEWYVSVIQHEIAHAFLGPQHSHVRGEMLSDSGNIGEMVMREISEGEASRVRFGQ